MNRIGPRRRSAIARCFGAVVGTIAFLHGAPVAAENAIGTSGGSAQRLVWENRPLSLTLIVGQETHIALPPQAMNVEVGIPQALIGLINEQHLRGNIFLEASKPFPKARLHVRAVNGDAYYLIDVQAIAKGTAPTEIVLADPTSSSTDVSASAEHDAPASALSGSSGRRTTEAPEILLTRFMAQQFYGPLRLAYALPDATRIAFKAAPGLAISKTLDLEAQAIAAWSYHDVYGLAVRFVNRTNHDVTIDFRNFRGDWTMATAQHPLLAAAGTPAAAKYGTNETMVYLITKTPIQTVLAELPSTEKGR